MTKFLEKYVWSRSNSLRIKNCVSLQYILTIDLGAKRQEYRPAQEYKITFSAATCEFHCYGYDRIWNLIVSVPDRCLSFYFLLTNNGESENGLYCYVKRIF